MINTPAKAQSLIYWSNADAAKACGRFHPFGHAQADDSSYRDGQARYSFANVNELCLLIKDYWNSMN